MFSRVRGRHGVCIVGKPFYGSLNTRNLYGSQSFEEGDGGWVSWTRARERAHAAAQAPRWRRDGPALPARHGQQAPLEQVLREQREQVAALREAAKGEQTEAGQRRERAASWLMMKLRQWAPPRHQQHQHQHQHQQPLRMLMTVWSAHVTGSSRAAQTQV